MVKVRVKIAVFREFIESEFKVKGEWQFINIITYRHLIVEVNFYNRRFPVTTCPFGKYRTQLIRSFALLISSNYHGKNMLAERHLFTVNVSAIKIRILVLD